MNRDGHLIAEAYKTISEQKSLPDSILQRYPGWDLYTNGRIVPPGTKVDSTWKKQMTIPGKPRLGTLVGGGKPAGSYGSFNQVTITPAGNLDLNENILFDFDKSNLKPGGVKVIQNITKKILSIDNPGVQVIVIGYTDLYGGSGYNQQLGMSRAQAVLQALQKAGVSRVSAKPGGMKNAKVPLQYNLVDGKAPQEGIRQQQPNRRVEIEFNPPLPRQIINGFISNITP